MVTEGAKNQERVFFLLRKYIYIFFFIYIQSLSPDIGEKEYDSIQKKVNLK